jgi:toxin-antitoxin system PIN domain toxin
LILPDVNVLVAAFREDTPAHSTTRTWLEDQINGPGAFGMADRVLEGFLRVTTHPRVFRTPTPPEAAITFIDSLIAQENCVRIHPGSRQWTIFLELIKQTQAEGNAVADAWLAALAIESGSQWITWDRGFARFPDLNWEQPNG